MKMKSEAKRTPAPGDARRPLDPKERVVMQLCKQARDFEEVSKYEEAWDAISEYLSPSSARLQVEGLSLLATAEIYLRAGTIKGYIASAKQLPGTQAESKELITQAVALFRQAGHAAKEAEATAELGCYLWRAGNFNGARRLLRKALAVLGNGADELRAKLVAMLRLAVVESDSGHLSDALVTLGDCERLLRSFVNNALKGALHNNRGIVFKKLGQASGDRGFLERAVSEYTLADGCFERAGAKRLRAHSKNNLAIVLHLLGSFGEAAERLAEARKLFSQLGDNLLVAQADETWAKMLVDERRCEEAEPVAAGVVRVMEESGRRALLAEALTTLGGAQAGCGRFVEARATLGRAVESAEAAGAWETAARAAISILEVVRERRDFIESRKFFERAYSEPWKAHDAHTLGRFIEAAFGAFALTHEWKFSDGRPAVPSAGLPAPAANDLRTAALRLSATNSPALVTEGSAEMRLLLASYAHELSGRTGRFVIVPCADLETDFDSQKSLARAVRRAAGGTLFLEEFQELSHRNQSLIQRMISRGTFECAGASTRRKRVNVRVIAGTSCGASSLDAEGLVPKELLGLLSGSGPQVTPPTDALEDLRALAGCFIKAEVGHCYPRGAKLPEAAALVLRAPAAGAAGVLARQLMRMYGAAASPSEPTPGAGAGGASATADTTAATGGDEGGDTLKGCVRHVEESRIREAMEDTNWNVSKAASHLGMARTTLQNRLTKHHPQLEAMRKKRTQGDVPRDGDAAAGKGRGAPGARE
jgi:DNA-binding NtrC family response regulator